MEGTTQPPFTPAMIDGFTEIVEKRLKNKICEEKDVFNVYCELTTYNKRTRLFKELCAKLEQRGYEII